jgi:hypothetical protein
MNAFGKSGAGILPAPAITGDEVKNQYRVFPDPKATPAPCQVA